MRRGAVALSSVMLAVLPAVAAATPVSFPHGTLDYQFTTTHTNAPAGWTFKGDYHAAGDTNADPPYMRSMTFHNPVGYRVDTSVPERCTASDAQLALFGPSACPPGSQIAAGTATGKFQGQTTTLDVSVFNNTGEQVMVGQSPLVATVVHGVIGPDASVTYASPTCYPAIPSVPCAVDDVLQLGSAVSGEAITRTVNGVVVSYATTPPTCPKVGYWQTPISFIWADGTQDAGVTRQSCTRRR